MSELPLYLGNSNTINNVSVVADITSPTPIEVKSAKSFSVQASWSGSSPLGTVNIQLSNDGINYTTVDTISVTGNVGSGLKNYPDYGVAYAQATYTHTSGTGTLTVNISMKQ